ncbi:hypothetical protein PLESTF_001107100 [Pleodorina starrii]|nr:hypothetical protein PLESTF_001107100 [Pleodorina starrii]
MSRGPSPGLLLDAADAYLLINELQSTGELSVAAAVELTDTIRSLQEQGKEIHSDMIVSEVRRCGICQQPGHDRRNCPQGKTVWQQPGHDRGNCPQGRTVWQQPGHDRGNCPQGRTVWQQPGYDRGNCPQGRTVPRIADSTRSSSIIMALGSWLFALCTWLLALGSWLLRRVMQ